MRREEVTHDVQSAAGGSCEVCGGSGLGGDSAEQHIESRSRIADHRQRFSGRRPAKRVRVGAGVVVATTATLVRWLNAKLQGR